MPDYIPDIPTCRKGVNANCKHVVASFLRLDRCPSCNWCTCLVEISRAHPPAQAPTDVEAMREACAKVAVDYGQEGYGNPLGREIAATIRALPLPKAKPPSGDVELREALKCAVGHIEHMAAWIGSVNGVKSAPLYSFESLGEDMSGIKDALKQGELS